MGITILGTGHHVPGVPVTNDQLSAVMETSDEWIYPRTGIKQRHFVAEGEGVSDLALKASQRPGAIPLPQVHSSRFAPIAEPTLDTAVRAMGLLALEILGAPDPDAPGAQANP